MPSATLSPELAARSVTLMAPSKTYNVPGLGTSFAIIPDAALRQRLAVGAAIKLFEQVRQIDAQLPALVDKILMQLKLRYASNLVTHDVR